METQPQPDPYRWSSFRDGAVPEGVAPHGWDGNGGPVWVCRARFSGGVHPGMIRPAAGGALVAWGGSEHLVTEYEVLLDAGEWVEARSGAIPPHAYSAGAEPNGEILYVARAEWQGALLAGKVRSAFRAANVAAGDTELELDRYQVLVLPAAAVPPPGRDRLVRGDSLGDGEVLTSPNGRVVLSHDESSGITWITRDGDRQVLTATGMQESSKLVLTREGGPRLVRPSGYSVSWYYGLDPRWPVAALVVQDDGDVALLDEQGGVLWRTRSGFPRRLQDRTNEDRVAYLRQLDEAGAWVRALDLEWFTVTLVRGVGPAAALQLIGAGPADIGPMTIADASPYDGNGGVSELRGIVAAAIGTSSILIEPDPLERWKALDDLDTLSRNGGAAVLFGEDIEALTWFGYAKDGVRVVDASDGPPDVDENTDARFRALFERLDRRDRWDDFDAECNYRAIAELACLIAEVQPTPADIAGPFLGARIPLG